MELKTLCDVKQETDEGGLLVAWLTNLTSQSALTSARLLRSST